MTLGTELVDIEVTPEICVHLTVSARTQNIFTEDFHAFTQFLEVNSRMLSLPDQNNNFPKSTNNPTIDTA
jgi:hypothetical protein